MRCTTQRCHAAPGNTSSMARRRPSWASDVTQRTPPDPALAQRAQEGGPARVRLGVDGVEAEQPAVAVGSRADGRDERARRHMSAVPALDVGGVHPNIGKGHVGQIAALQVGHDFVQRPADAGYLGRAHAVHPQGRGHPPRLPRGHAVGHHLGHRRDHRPVGPRVAHEQVLREVAAAAQLGDAKVYGADAGGERALAVAVSLVAVGAGVLGLRVHDLVDERLGHYPNQLLDVDHAVVESGNLGHGGRAVL